MTCALIITTYNWKEALELSIQSAINQSEAPDEIIIADDGSTSDTKELVEKYMQNSNVKITHSWQEDDGFRTSMSRNKAISKASSEYLILIDGDMILHRDFIKEHKKFASKDCFIQGSRVLLSEDSSRKILSGAKTNISFFDKDIKNRKNAIHSNVLASLLATKTKSHKGIKTCNMSLYKSDCLEVNGFNEDFIGWGREDSEFVERLYNNGLQRQNVKFNAIAFHIWHNENSRKSLERNDKILENTIKNKLSFCKNGIDKYKTNH